MIKFEYNQWYEARNRAPVRIVIAIGTMVLGSNGMWYTNGSEDGYKVGMVDGAWDLLRLIPDPTGKPLVPYQIGEEYGKTHRMEDVCDNPYTRGSESHKEWVSGFLSGYAEQWMNSRTQTR